MNHFLGKSVGGALFAVLSACVLPACKTDLSDVWNSIDNIDDRLSQVEKKIEEMNTNIDALSKICDALSSNVSVSSVTPLQDASGYEIVFSDGTKATIHNGTDGKDGHFQTVSVAYDQTTGSYYWTVDGEPLPDASGNKVKANGTDAELPRLASGASLGEPYVQDATYISVDGGKTWTRISGENGVSFFESVKADESSSKVTLVLADGTVIEVPSVKDFMFAFAESDVKATTAHSVCTPSSDAAYYLMKHANDTQWSVIDQQEQGGIYEYVCRNGYKLKATDVYDWTGLVGTYSDGKIEFADNGAVGGPYTLQGYCWVAFDSDGNPVGRADAVIPVNISFGKYAQTASVAAKSRAEISGRTVADRTNARDSRSQMLFGFDIE